MKKKNPIKYIHCHGCGKRIPLRRSKFCSDCFKLDARLDIENIPLKTRKVFWAYIRKDGHRCSLSGVSLELDDDKSPWFLVLSRLIPGDKSKIFPMAALFAVMKGRFLIKELRYYVLALDDHRKKHLKVKKIPLVNWKDIRLPKDEKLCAGCMRAAALKRRQYCARCARIALRMNFMRFPREAINGVWDYIRKYGYVCYYTGMPLDLDDFKSAWYLVFDHWNPRDPRKIVITSALINEMKSDLTEDEFWYFIAQLAKHFRQGSIVRKKKLAFWSRPYQQN